MPGRLHRSTRGDPGGRLDVARLILILGGARSGKSRLAEQLARQSGRPVVYLATATPGDDEMRQRIGVHRANRPQTWNTIEEPIDLPAALDQTAPGDLVLLDCLTLWVSNLLLDGPSDEPPAVASGRIVEYSERFIAVLQGRDISMIAVSNEVGMGIVPSYETGRTYRDALGQVNQMLADKADSVYLMVAGLPLPLKDEPPDS